MNKKTTKGKFKMPINYNAPCSVTIFAEMPNGNTRTIRIPFTGYGAERHIKRWLNRGAISVTVYVDSRSTGRNVQRVTGKGLLARVMSDVLKQICCRHNDRQSFINAT